MPLPTSNNIVVPVAIQNLTIQYKPENFIGEKVFPIIPVASPEVLIMKYSKANMFRLQDGDLIREEGGLTKRFNYSVGRQQVAPYQISDEYTVPDELLDISQMPGQLPLQPIIDAVQHAVMKVDLQKELLVSQAIYQNTWADGTTGGSATSAGNGGWALDTTANSFVQDVYNAKLHILNTTGIRPNKLVIDVGTLYAQQFNPIIADKIKYTQRAVTTAELLASVLQLDEVLVGSAIYTTQNENLAETNSSFVGTQIWSPSGHGNAFLFHDEAPGLRALLAGAQFRLPYMGSMRFVRGYRDENIRSTVYQVTEKVEIAPVALDIGWAWTRTIS